MADLEDYSGEFMPRLDLRDFSKDFLVRLGREWSYAYINDKMQLIMDYLRKRIGWEEAEQLQLDVWNEFSRNLARRLAKLANIEVKTVLDCVKLNQLYLDGALIRGGPDDDDMDIEVKNPNHVIITYKHCPILKQWGEAGYTPEQIQGNCGGFGPKFYKESYFGVLLPDTKVKALRLPPEGKDGISCQWEVWR